MAKKKQSLFEDITQIASKLPWQASLILAIAAYVGCHYVATMPPEPVQPGVANIAPTLTAVLLRTTSSILQYVVPLAFVLGAIVSVVKRHKQTELHNTVAATPSRAALEKMSWREFESLTAEVFRRKGFKVIERGGAEPDGGVDVELRMGSDKYLVQCKQWKSLKVGVATVRELYGVMTAAGAAGGFVVASGDFTPDALSFAQGRAIKLVDTSEMLRMVTETRKEDAPQLAHPVLNQPLPQTAELSPRCPKCRAPMVLRSSKKVGADGNAFWGCSTFPGCRGVLKVE